MSNGTWGPTIKHDGTGCPVAGKLVKAWDASGALMEGVPSESLREPLPDRHFSRWHWDTIEPFAKFQRIVSYQVWQEGTPA